MTEKAPQPIAVALEYKPKEQRVPKVVATGRGSLAERIVRIAEQNGVAIHEDPELAKLLVRFDADAEIPAEAMLAVAEILAQVFLLNQRLAEGLSIGAHPHG